jgi:hypothetical protein
MFTPEDDSEILKKASYAAYNEAIKAAFRTLSASIAGYLAEHRELYDNEILDVPHNFRPLKDYERTLKIEELTLRLALRAAELSEHEMANSTGPPVYTNERERLPVVAALPT